MSSLAQVHTGSRWRSGLPLGSEALGHPRAPHPDPPPPGWPCSACRLLPCQQSALVEPVGEPGVRTPGFAEAVQPSPAIALPSRG